MAGYTESEILAQILCEISPSAYHPVGRGKRDILAQILCELSPAVHNPVGMGKTALARAIYCQVASDNLYTTPPSNGRLTYFDYIRGIACLESGGRPDLGMPGCCKQTGTEILASWLCALRTGVDPNAILDEAGVELLTEAGTDILIE